MSGLNRTAWTYVLLATATLLIPLAGIGWWIYVAETTPGAHADLVRRFLNPFPGILQSAVLITWIELAFCGASALFAYKGLDGRGLSKIVSLFLIGFSGLVGFWLLFSLM